MRWGIKHVYKRGLTVTFWSSNTISETVRKKDLHNKKIDQRSRLLKSVKEGEIKI